MHADRPRPALRRDPARTHPARTARHLTQEQALTDVLLRDGLSRDGAPGRERGGSADEVRREPSGLAAAWVDNQGIEFYLHELPRPGRAAPDTGAAPGDISYVDLLVPDSDSAVDSYRGVLGWQFEQRSPTGTAPMIGFGRGRGAARCFRVDDIEPAAARVRAAGGTATEAVQRSYALEADCADDQGTPFYLHQFPR